MGDTGGGGGGSHPSSSKNLPLKVKLQNTGISFVNRIILNRRKGIVHRRLLRLIEPKSPPSPHTPRHGILSDDITVDSTRNLWFRVYTPSAPSLTTYPVIIYFHGGGFVVFGPDTKPFDRFCRRLASTLPAIVISVNYRLAPENRYPSQCEDGFDILNYVDQNGVSVAAGSPAIADLGRCFLAGDSAGGNLAHQVVLKLSSASKPFLHIQIRGMVVIQPFFGGEERTPSENSLGKKKTRTTGLSLKTTDFFWKAFLPVGSNRDHEAANVVSVDLTGVKYPPTLVVVGGADLLLDWQRRYCDWLIKEGKVVEMLEYPNMPHGFCVTPDLRESSSLVEEMKDFMHRRTLEY